MDKAGFLLWVDQQLLESWAEGNFGTIHCLGKNLVDLEI